jgi:hypothetical protein
MRGGLSFGERVDERLAEHRERSVPATLRALGPTWRADRLFELVADLADALVAHDLPAERPDRVGDDTVREAAVAVAVMAAQLWLASTGWPEGTPAGPADG